MAKRTASAAAGDSPKKQKVSKRDSHDGAASHQVDSSSCAKQNGKRTLEELSVEVAKQFQLIKNASTSKSFEPCLSQLWSTLIPLRLSHKLALNFVPPSGQKRSTAELVWITESFRSLANHLKFRVKGTSAKIAKISFSWLLETLRVECEIRRSQTIPNSGFPLQLLQSILSTLLEADLKVFDSLLKFCKEEFIEKFQDIRYNVLSGLESITRELKVNKKEKNKPEKKDEENEQEEGQTEIHLANRIFLFLQQLPTPPQAAEMGTSLLTSSSDQSISGSSYQTAFVSCWTAFLKLDADELRLSSMVYKEVLSVLPTSLLPFMSSPLSLSKFFLTAFQANDIAVAVQALSGLFYLLVKSRLGEPQLIQQGGQDFYSRCLSLLHPKVFSMSVRVRFLRLLRLSLQSKMLSTEMRAIFVKKMIAVSLLTPPSATLWLLGVALQMLQSGGLAMSPLVHGKLFQAEDSDPLLPPAPTDMGAIPVERRLLPWDSKAGVVLSGEGNREAELQRMSLWEIEILKKHFYPSVVQVAELFGFDMFKPNATRIDPDDFLSFDTSALLLHELKHLMKKAEKPQTLPFAISPQPINETGMKLLQLGSSIHA